PVPQTVGSCNTGSLQCCKSVQEASDLDTSMLEGILDTVLLNLNGMVGLTCSPITAIRLGVGASCSAQPVCCEDNSYGSLISLGCAPVSL
ncbi:fungal hydrophobin, partial [Neolentinus lepideus HHB14362 ss-1]